VVFTAPALLQGGFFSGYASFEKNHGSFDFVSPVRREAAIL
jgi:hypothetical protein